MIILSSSQAVTHVRVNNESVICTINQTEITPFSDEQKDFLSIKLYDCRSEVKKKKIDFNYKYVGMMLEEVIKRVVVPNNYKYSILVCSTTDNFVDIINGVLLFFLKQGISVFDVFYCARIEENVCLFSRNDQKIYEFKHPIGNQNIVTVQSVKEEFFKVISNLMTFNC
ncbi:hypothetical protein NUSPORA_00037 [Nucleospora cyclopteri]